jgi:hypothetical protein
MKKNKIEKVPGIILKSCAHGIEICSRDSNRLDALNSQLYFLKEATKLLNRQVEYLEKTTGICKILNSLAINSTKKEDEKLPLSQQILNLEKWLK